MYIQSIQTSGTSPNQVKLSSSMLMETLGVIYMTTTKPETTPAIEKYFKYVTTSCSTLSYCNTPLI